MLVGSERAVVPLVGEQSFAVSSTALLLAFVVAFGFIKGPLNLVAGRLADRWGRRNVLLGANQGFAWSMTVTSKVDLVGRSQRGLALGINEFSGYIGVAIASAVTGALAATYGLRPAPFIFAAIVAVMGFLLVLLVRETTPFVHLEQKTHGGAVPSAAQPMREIFADVTWRDKTLRACSQAGCINKFSDAAIWVLLPLGMAAQGWNAAAIGAVA